MATPRMIAQNFSRRGRGKASLQEQISRLQQQNRDLEKFVHYLAYDLRTPLCALQTFAHALEAHSHKELNAPSQSAIAGILRTAKTMNDMILGLQAISQADPVAAPLPVDMNALVAELWQELNPAHRPVQFKKRPLMPTYGDSRTLRQVWVNLLENALKFTQDRELALIEVGGQVNDHECIYYVRDNGVGFDTSESHRLFGLFQRLHETRDYPGHGVGLAIVQQVAQKHGGRVWAHGMRNQGATFYFALPRMAHSNTVASDRPSLPPRQERLYAKAHYRLSQFP